MSVPDLKYEPDYSMALLLRCLAKSLKAERGPRQVSSRRPRLLIGYLADVSHPDPAALLSQVRQSIAVAGDDLLDQTIELSTVLGME